MTPEREQEIRRLVEWEKYPPEVSRGDLIDALAELDAVRAQLAEANEAMVVWASACQRAEDKNGEHWAQRDLLTAQLREREAAIWTLTGALRALCLTILAEGHPQVLVEAQKLIAEAEAALAPPERQS